MKTINNEERLEKMAIEFWREIHPCKDWKNTEDFDIEKELHEKMNTSYYDLHADRYDMEAVFNICRQLAKRIGGSDSCYKLEFDPIFDGAIKLKYVAFGWGDPQVTSRYSYIYFDFSIDGEGRAYVSRDDQEDRLLTIEEMFNELYA